MSLVTPPGHPAGISHSQCPAAARNRPPENAGRRWASWCASLAASLLLPACSQHPAPDPAALARLAKQQEITRDFQSWYTYAYYQTPLGRPFTALDSSGQPLPRRAFLRQLTDGRQLALSVGQPATAGPPTYRLFAYRGGGDIASTSQQRARAEVAHCDQENRPMPPFSFRDLAGRTYTSASTQGQLLVLKAWFIGCTACVAEFPQVNALVEEYGRRYPDVRFISLARDEAPRLRAFLAGHPLRYATVPASSSYLENQLQVVAYPTHIVVGRDGTIVKYCNTAADLAATLSQEIRKLRN